MDDLGSWVRAHAARAGGSGRTLQLALMGADPGRYERFRYRVLLRCLCARLGQPEAQVVALLRQELLGELARGVPASDDDGPDEPSDDGDPRLELGPADILQFAIDRLDDGDVWERLAQVIPERPVAWAALHVARRVLDRLRPHGRVASSSAQPRAHHAVGERLDALREAQHVPWGAIPDAERPSGAYEAVLRAIRDCLAQEAGTAGVSYALRKLFPYHAWAPGDHAEPLPAWLLDRLAAVWSDAPPPCAPDPLRSGLDALALHHLRRDSYPSWAEVAAWTREQHVAANTLQRRVSRLDEVVRALLDAAIDALRAERA